jgi:hypothetical protein
MYRFLIAALVIGLHTGSAAASADGPKAARDMINRAVALIEKSLDEYPRHNSCFSCHHQGMASLALSLARSHGYTVKDDALAAVARHTEADLRVDLESYKQGRGQPGGVTRAGYALFALGNAEGKPDEITGAVAGFLLKRDGSDGFWHAGSNRPPAEASDFTNTFLAIRGLKAYGMPDGRESVAADIARAREWLEVAPPKDTEDRVFQLWGLKEAGSESGRVQRAAKELLALQKEDGGWAQLPGGASEAYATGSALTALQLSGQLATGDTACRRGVDYLRRTQEPDGSWHVVSRSKPVQPYFESGFPHGRDQFISIAATGWAVSALVLALPDESAH